MTFLYSFRRLAACTSGLALAASLASAQLAFTEQPQPLIVPPGAPAGFAVTVNDATNVTYQWFREDTALPGQTHDLLLIAASSDDDTGEYWVRVTSPGDSIESNHVELDVIPEELPTTTTLNLPDNLYRPALVSTPLPDGKILLGYDELLRLNADGTHDESFVAPDLNTRNGRIQTMAADPSGNVLIYGNRGDGTNFVILLRADNASGEPFPYQLHVTNTFAWPRSIISLGTDEWLIASGSYLDLYRDGQVVNSWSFGSISPTTPLQKDDDGQVWFGADDKLHRFSIEDGPIEHLGPADFRLIPGGGFFGIETESQRAGGSVLILTTSISRYHADGTLDDTWTPFFVQKLSYDGGELDLLPQSDGSLWVKNTNSFYDSYPLSPSGLAGSSPVTFDDAPVLSLVRRGIFRLDPSGHIDLKRSIRTSNSAFLAQNSETTEIIVRQGSAIQRFNPTDQGALVPPRVLRAAPSQSTYTVGESALVDAVIVGSGTIDQGSLREDSPRQQVRLTPTKRDSVYGIQVENLGGTHFFALPVTYQESAPQWPRAPDTLVVQTGKTFTLPLAAVGTTPLEYSLSRNGEPLFARINSLPEFPAADATSSGTYTVTAHNPLGDTVHTIELSVAPTSRLSNLSVRALAGSGENRIVLGHVLTGGSSKRTLLRGIGPTMAQDYGVADALPTPQMRLRDHDGVLLEDLDHSDYFNDIFKRIEINQLGAFSTAFLTEPEVFRIHDLQPSGLYTLEVFPEDDTPGIALAEIYDADQGTARLINLSARALAGTDAEAIMAGFVIAGEQPLTVLIRAVGPSLAAYGVTHPSTDPVLTLLDPATGETLRVNDDWIASDELNATTQRVGAFPLETGSTDAALLVTLDPGVYVAQFSNASDTPAIGLVEIYDASE